LRAFPRHSTCVGHQKGKMEGLKPPPGPDQSGQPPAFDPLKGDTQPAAPTKPSKEAPAPA